MRRVATQRRRQPSPTVTIQPRLGALSLTVSLFISYLHHSRGTLFLQRLSQLRQDLPQEVYVGGPLKATDALFFSSQDSLSAFSSSCPKWSGKQKVRLSGHAGFPAREKGRWRVSICYCKRPLRVAGTVNREVPSLKRLWCFLSKTIRSKIYWKASSFSWNESFEEALFTRDRNPAITGSKRAVRHVVSRSRVHVIYGVFNFQDTNDCYCCLIQETKSAKPKL